MADEIQTEGENVVQMPPQGDPKPEDTVAFGIHVVLMQDGNFGMQATGQPNLGEMQMLLSRALKSIEARMVAETIMAMQQEKRIITPNAAGPLV